MNLIGIEITDMDAGQARFLECDCEKGRVKLKSGGMASFDTPFLEVSPKVFKSFLRENGIKSKNLLVILPEDTHRSILWTADKPEDLPEIIDAQKDDLRIKPDTVLQSSLSGQDEYRCYGITTAIDNAMLDGFYRIFAGLNVQYMLPQMTAYSLLGRGWPDEDTGLLDLRRDELTLAVYHREILAWTITMSYIGGRDREAVCGAAKRALNAAKGSRYYPSMIRLVGELSNEDGINGMLSEALETDCEKWEYTVGGVQAVPSLSTLIGVIRGLSVA